MRVFCLGLDQAGTPLLLLTQDGTVLHANTAAQSALKASSVLRLEHQRLATTRLDEMDLLTHFVASPADAATQATPDASLVLRNRDGSAIMILALHRLDLPEIGRVGILRVADLRTWPVPEGGWLSMVFGLTKAETRVITSLFAGHDLVATATARQCSLATVRTLLKRGMRKLGVTTQAQMQAVLHCAVAARQ